MARQLALLTLFLLILTFQQTASGTNETTSSQTNGTAASQTNGTAGQPPCQASDSKLGSSTKVLIALCSSVLTVLLIGSIALLIFLVIQWIIQKRRDPTIQGFRARYRVSKFDALPMEEYQWELNVLKRLMEEVRVGTKIFSFFEEDYGGEITRDVLVSSFTTKKNLEEYETQITIEASDYKGSWEGKGGFILTEAGPFFWMLKWYNYMKDIRIRNEQILVFESTRISAEGAQGRWFVQGKENNKHDSGTWEIADKSIIGGPKP